VEVIETATDERKSFGGEILGGAKSSLPSNQGLTVC
jgi:hypothetical protein